ncbi:MAG: hypothetical protein Q7S68_01550 [Deltaproteobacteria bacterium]|nr:hypothetical protein [Deltaproteobacteria bacterium]
MKTFFEITPPSHRAKQDRVAKTVATTKETLDALPNIDGVNVPEIIEENFLGKPFYKNMETREFGRQLHDAIHKEVIINKVVVHEKNFKQWAKETKEKFGLNKVILVGGTFPFQKYPGPTVLEANRIATEAGLTVGNIAIATRPEEEIRMLEKIKSGTKFFSTQVIFEAESTKTTLQKLQTWLEKEKLPAPAVYLSFAPLSDAEDIVFTKWLGAVIPPAVEEKLLRSANIGEASIQQAAVVWREIQDFCREKGITIPIGLNIEPINAKNLTLACQLTKTLQN